MREPLAVTVASFVYVLCLHTTSGFDRGAPCRMRPASASHADHQNRHTL